MYIVVVVVVLNIAHEQCASVVHKATLNQLVTLKVTHKND